MTAYLISFQVTVVMTKTVNRMIQRLARPLVFEDVLLRAERFCTSRIYFLRRRQCCNFVEHYRCSEWNKGNGNQGRITGNYLADCSVNPMPNTSELSVSESVSCEYTKGFCPDKNGNSGTNALSCRAKDTRCVYLPVLQTESAPINFYKQPSLKMKSRQSHVIYKKYITITLYYIVIVFVSLPRCADFNTSHLSVWRKFRFIS